MPDSMTSVARKHHAYYEVSPYYVTVEEKHGSASASSRQIHAGFDVDVFGANVSGGLQLPGGDPDYVLGYEVLNKLAQAVSEHATGSCSAEVISSPWMMFFDPRKHDSVQGKLRIRISHHRGLGRPAGEPEQRALKEVEEKLGTMGVARR